MLQSIKDARDAEEAGRTDARVLELVAERR